MANLECQTSIENLCNVPENKEELLEFLKFCAHNPDAKMNRNVKIFDWLPGYIVKYGIERIKNSQRLQNVIHENNLTELSVPKKYALKIKTDDESDSVVIAEYIEGETNENGNKKALLINLKEIKQLVILADKANNYDLHVSNMIRSKKDNKIYIIDTDILAMPSPCEVKRLRERYIKYGKELFGYMENTINDTSTKLEIKYNSQYQNFTEDARNFLSVFMLQREMIRIHLNGKFYAVNEIPSDIIERATYDVIIAQKKYIHDGLSENVVMDLLDLTKM